jgi:hypothetical protein
MLSKLLDASHGASSRGYARRSFRSVRHGCTCVVRHHEPVSDSSRVDIRSVREILAHHARLCIMGSELLANIHCYFTNDCSFVMPPRSTRR